MCVMYIYNIFLIIKLSCEKRTDPRVQYITLENLEFVPCLSD